MKGRIAVIFAMLVLALTMTLAPSYAQTAPPTQSPAATTQAPSKLQFAITNRVDPSDTVGTAFAVALQKSITTEGADGISILTQATSGSGELQITSVKVSDTQSVIVLVLVGITPQGQPDILLGYGLFSVPSDPDVMSAKADGVANGVLDLFETYEQYKAQQAAQ